jgi:hypothetical protein
VGPVPRFPEALEAAIDRYLDTPVEPLAPQHPPLVIPPPDHSMARRD